MIETAKSDFETTQTDQVLRYDVVDVFLGKKPDHDDIDDYLGERRIRHLQPRPRLRPRSDAQADLCRPRRRRHRPSRPTSRLALLIEPLAEQLADARQAGASIDELPEGRRRLAAAGRRLRHSIGGRVAIVSVAPIVSNWDDQTQKPGHYLLSTSPCSSSADDAAKRSHASNTCSTACTSTSTPDTTAGRSRRADRQ